MAIAEAEVQLRARKWCQPFKAHTLPYWCRFLCVCDLIVCMYFWSFFKASYWLIYSYRQWFWQSSYQTRSFCLAEQCHTHVYENHNKMMTTSTRTTKVVLEAQGNMFSAMCASSIYSLTVVFIFEVVFILRSSFMKCCLPSKVVKLSSGGTRCALDCFKPNGYSQILSRS